MGPLSFGTIHGTHTVEAKGGVGASFPLYHDRLGGSIPAWALEGNRGAPLRTSSWDYVTRVPQHLGASGRPGTLVHLTMYSVEERCRLPGEACLAVWQGAASGLRPLRRLGIENNPFDVYGEDGTEQS